MTSATGSHGQPAPPATPSAPALPYHRLARSWPRARWWRPLAGLLLAAAIYLAASFAVAAIFGVATFFAPALAGSGVVTGAFDQYNPADFAFTMVSIALMLPSSLLGFWIVGCRPLGLLSSVAGRVRWRWMLVCTGPALAVLAAALVLEIALVPAPEVPPGQVPVGSVLLFVLIVVLTPLQAAAEEYAFRGVLMQTIGAWLRHPAWAILLPVPLFVLGHTYDLPGQVSIAVFAIALGWITWRTGGLEAAIALHVVNNLAVILLGAAGLGDLNATEVSWPSAVISALVPVAYVLWIDRLWQRRVARTRASQR